MAALRPRVARVSATLVVTGMLVAALGYLAHTTRGTALEVLPADGSGSWWFPRGGPYAFALDGSGAVSMAIDGDKVLEGHGFTAARKIYEPGVHRVELGANTPGSRLLWNPPWRSGPLEEVLPSSLSPDPPVRAEFTAPGTDHVGAAIAAGFLLVFLWALLRLSLPFEDGRIWGPGLAIFIAAAVARVVLLRAGGPTLGEDALFSTGLNYLRGLLGGAPPTGVAPVGLYLAGVGALADDSFQIARLLIAGLGAGGCVLAFAAGARLFGVRAGFFAGMTCALLPQLIGHARLIEVATPSLFLVTMAVWLAVAATQDDGPHPVWLVLRLCAAGVALGLAAGTRLENLFFLPVVLIAGMIPARRPHVVRTVLLVAAVVPLAAAGLLFAIWPDLVLDPLAGLALTPERRAALLHTAEMVLATTPLVVLALAALAGGLRAAFKRERAWLVVLAWIAAPVGIALLPERAGDLSDVLPVLVPLAIAAGAGLDALLERLASVAFLLGLLYVAWMVVLTNQIHPYHLDYYGVQVGGAAGVVKTGRFPFGARGEGIGRAVGFVNARAAPGDRVASFVEPRQLAWWRNDLWAGLTDSAADATWIVVNAPRLRDYHAAGRRAPRAGRRRRRRSARPSLSTRRGIEALMLVWGIVILVVAALVAVWWLAARRGLTRGRAGRLVRLSRLSARLSASWLGARIRRLFARGERRTRIDEARRTADAAAVAQTMGEMKGALMKLGQMVSFITDDIPPEYRAALATLQAQAPPLDFPLVRDVIEHELGKPLERAFARFDEKPLAAASIGQVHTAQLPDGREVVVKVQYPGVAEAIAADLANVAVLYRFVGMMYPALDPAPVVAELRGRITEELDYAREADNQEKFAVRFDGHPLIHVPHVIRSHSTARVLCSERAGGRRFAEAVTAPEALRRKWAEAIYRFVFSSILQAGMFNGDPHPGNYLFQDDGRVTFLDFGCVKYFPPQMLSDWKTLVQKWFLKEPDAFRAQLVKLSFIKEDSPLKADLLVRYFGFFYEPFAEDREFEFTPEYNRKSFGMIFAPSGEFEGMSRKMNMPPDFVFVNRIQWGVWSILGQLDAKMNWHRIHREYLFGEV